MRKIAPPPTQTKQEAMISFWEANCLHEENTGLLIAPEAFTAPEDIKLTDGSVVKRGSMFFDWYAAEALSAEGKFGNGWRLPTDEEAKRLSDKADLLFKSIRHGYVGPNDMMVCRHAPDMAVEKLLNTTSAFFWTSTSQDKVYAYFAEITSGKALYSNVSMYKSFGLGILCVKDA